MSKRLRIKTSEHSLADMCFSMMSGVLGLCFPFEQNAIQIGFHTANAKFCTKFNPMIRDVQPSTKGIIYKAYQAT